ncbi:myb-like protein X [Mercenaria mercenaria]|uniref:myb-like protein X n=1 Tax=Mercenaria mercenaria TaxID=6596 RepID=UPI00234F743F|nr:myb-like protein X [Mercenaria mercenaria]
MTSEDKSADKEVKPAQIKADYAEDIIENVQETTENTENKKGKTADDTKQSPSIKDRENKNNKDEETAHDTNQSLSNKEQETTENTEGATADDTKQSPSIKDRENKNNKDEETAHDTNQSPSNKEQETTENTEGATADDTKQSPSNNEGENKRDKEKKTADDANNPLTLNERENTENTEHRNEETADDTHKPQSESEQDTNENTENNVGEKTRKTNTKQPPSINEGDDKENEEKETADDTKIPQSENERENTEKKMEETTDDTNKPPSINEGDDKRNKKKETADDTKNLSSEDFVERYDSDGPEQKKEHLSFTSKNTNGDVNGPGKAVQVDVGGDEDKEKPEKPGKKQMLLTSENTNGDEFDPHMTKVNERKTKENEEEEIKATSSKHTLQGDIVGDDNKERVEKQDEKHLLLTSVNTNGIEFDPNNEGLSQAENEVADSGLLSQERGSMNTNDKEDDASHANKQGDAVIPGADNRPEAKNDRQSENRVQATDDKSKDITKEENTATYSAKVDDTPEAKESEANVVKETEKEEAVKKIRIESNFEELLRKEQKKIIMDAKKLVEQHLSEEIEKAGTDLIVQEHGIDTEKQESVVYYLKKCVNICWSMHSNEPPVFVEFPDITENIVFDTNKFKPYTKSGKYIDYIVWPAVYLHEGGPLLCKGVAQGRKE